MRNPHNSLLPVEMNFHIAESIPSSDGAREGVADTPSNQCDKPSRFEVIAKDMVEALYEIQNEIDRRHQRRKARTLCLLPVNVPGHEPWKRAGSQK